MKYYWNSITKRTRPQVKFCQSLDYSELLLPFDVYLPKASLWSIRALKAGWLGDAIGDRDSWSPKESLKMPQERSGALQEVSRAGQIKGSTSNVLFWGLWVLTSWCKPSYPLMPFTIVLASRVGGIVPNVSHTLRYIALGTLSSPSPSSSYSGSTNSLYVTSWKSYGQIRCFSKANYHRSIVPNIGSKTPPQPKAYLRSDAAKVTTYQFKIGVFNWVC